MSKRKRLTVGCRAKIRPEVESTWQKMLSGRDLLLTERSGRSFAAMVLKKGVSAELTERCGSVVYDEVAWISEEELKLVNSDFEANLNFIDWYKEREYDFCPECGHDCEDKSECPKCNTAV